MGNQQQGDDDKGADLVICQSVSKISCSHSMTDLNIDDFLNEKKEATPIDNLQRLWERDSAIWTSRFNNKRDKFLKMIKLTKSLRIRSISNYENIKEMRLQIDAELNLNQELINKEIFQFSLSKSYKSDIEINQIKDFKNIDWILNIEWKDKNAYTAISGALKPNQSRKQNDRNNVEEILNEFTSFILQWLSSGNVEQFRIKTVDETNESDLFAK